MNNIERAIDEILTTNQVSEYELIKRLQLPPYDLFGKDSLFELLELFQTHFIIYNALYSLDELGLKLNEYRIFISPLVIKKIPIKSSTNQTNEVSTLAIIDDCQTNSTSLRNYYLNWKNFEFTETNDVEELIDGFWTMFNELTVPQSMTTKEALRVLGIDTPRTLKELKQAYRRTTFNSHPDKGGNSTDFISSMQAYKTLKSQLF